jgi:hypothetical protein
MSRVETTRVGRTAVRHLIPDAVAKGFALLVSTLREIFDESAYTRFLQRNGLARSRVAYQEFLREHATAKARRPKCC